MPLASEQLIMDRSPHNSPHALLQVLAKLGSGAVAVASEVVSEPHARVVVDEYTRDPATGR